MQPRQPDDKELAKLYRWTLHTRWGVSGSPFSGVGADDDFTCMCDSCRKSRKDRWARELHTDPLPCSSASFFRSDAFSEAAAKVIWLNSGEDIGETVPTNFWVRDCNKLPEGRK